MTDTDLAILRVLQENCSLPLAAISEKVNLSTASCHRRIKSLESNGTIICRRALLNPHALGLMITGIFMIRLARDTADVDQRMMISLRRQPNVVACYLVTGEYDFLLITRFRTAGDYTDYIYSFLDTFREVPIQAYSSSLVVRTLREETRLPI
ncbi:Lrp/AsnC family transcriptional regulator [Paracoccus sp. (in: a-proteobacteria)]|uniref:Lrp/AsnC family transcriptional regulator n=1 Tax=Paracoccus sp. TaxID=267 RepID=UPI003A8590A2